VGEAAEARRGHRGTSREEAEDGVRPVELSAFDAARADDRPSDVALLHQQVLPDLTQPPSADGVNGTSTLHVVDQSIQDIAREFRFTVEEVQEYYDRCGAMDRTRARFKKMRDAIAMLYDDENEQ